MEIITIYKKGWRGRIGRSCPGRDEPVELDHRGDEDLARDKTTTRAPKAGRGKAPAKPGKASGSAPKATRAIGRPSGKGGIGKEVLIARTAELLRTLPPEKLSLSAAARHAGVHLTLFKYYFQDLNTLLVDVARVLSKEIGDRVAAIEHEGTSARERLAIRVDAMVDFFSLNPFYHRLMAEILRNDSSPAAAEMIELWRSRTVDIYRSIIEAGVAEGTLRRVDPQSTFLAVMGLCEQCGHAAQLALRGPFSPAATPAEAVARYKEFVLALILDGIGAQ